MSAIEVEDDANGKESMLDGKGAVTDVDGGGGH